MKVTIDTRHDSLEEALETVCAAFGSKENSGTPDERRESSRKITATGAPSASRARSVGRAATRPATERHPTKSSSRATRKPGKARKSTSSMNPTSNIAPPGQADSIRAWAKAQGMQVKQAGRLPAAVIRAYQEATPS